MATMGQRLQEALDRRELQATDVIRATKLAKGTIYNILNDTTKPEKIWGATAKRICAYLRISSDWLITGRGSMDDLPADSTQADWDDIRGVRQPAALGDGSFPDEYAETHKLKFRASSLRKQGLKGDSLVVYYGDGDSMEPRIRKGDALLFDLSDKSPVDGSIYLLSSPDSGLTVKRLVNYGGRWFLEADNKHARNWSKPIPMDGERHPYTIEGKLRWIGSWEG